jgi:hypothetical protein
MLFSSCNTSDALVDVLYIDNAISLESDEIPHESHDTAMPASRSKKLLLQGVWHVVTVISSLKIIPVWRHILVFFPWLRDHLAQKSRERD